MQAKNRCVWVGVNKPHYDAYHDTEWGVPSHDDQHLFEMLVLEGAQAGLNWETILKKRAAYREAFHHFVPQRVASMTDDELAGLLSNTGIVRNRLKIASARRNARVFLEIQKEAGSFAAYLWRYVDGKPLQNGWSSHSDVPARTALSDKISKDLQKRGMNFVGSTIIYAYMQAVGLVNDHVTGCFRCRELYK